MQLRLFLTAALCISRVAAQDLKLEALKLEDLVAQALDRNPEILVAQKKYEAARQRPSQAATLPETRLLAGMEQQWQSTAGRRARTRHNLEYRILHYARDPVPGQTEAARRCFPRRSRRAVCLQHRHAGASRRLECRRTRLPFPASAPHGRGPIQRALAKSAGKITD